MKTRNIELNSLEEKGAPIGEIVSNIPLPGRRPRKLTSIAALLASMKVGDSVRLSRAERDGIFMHAKSARVRITTRRLDAETFRVWRLPDEEAPEEAA
jgi:hypothetical protein